MTAKQGAALAAFFTASFALLVIRAANNGSFAEPITYLGMAVGAAIALAAWYIGKRRLQRGDR